MLLCSQPQNVPYSSRYLFFIAMYSLVIQLELRLSNGTDMYGSNPKKK